MTLDTTFYPRSPMMTPNYHEMIKEDRAFGVTAEQSVNDCISEYCGERMFSTARFFIIDFEGSKCIAELKTRRCESTRYNTTMLPDSKIDYLLEMVVQGGKRAYVFINFTDGLFVFEVNETSVRHIERGQRGGRSDRARNEYNNHYAYIPLALLTKIKNSQGNK